MATNPENESGRSKAYLKRIFELNPLFQADELLALRRRYQRRPALKSSPSEGGNELRDRREQLQGKIELLRGQFWNMDLKELQESCRLLPTEEFPDLQAAVQRLDTLATHRSKLPALSQDRRFNPELFASLKQIFIRPQREVGALKSRLVNSLDTRAEVKSIKRMLQLLEEKVPELYAMEKDWFQSLKNLKPAKVAARQTRTEVPQSSSWEWRGFDLSTWGWGGGLLIFFLLRFLIAMMRGN